MISAACLIVRCCSSTVFSTWILACYRRFNVTSLMGDICAEQLAGDLIVEHQHIIQGHKASDIHSHPATLSTVDVDLYQVSVG